MIKKKKWVPWTHISHPSKRLFSPPTPIFSSHSHLYSYLPNRGEVLRFQFHTIEMQHFIYFTYH